MRGLRSHLHKSLHPACVLQVALEIYDMQGHVFQNDYDLDDSKCADPACTGLSTAANRVGRRDAVDAMARFVRKEVAREGSVPSQRPRL